MLLTRVPAVALCAVIFSGLFSSVLSAADLEDSRDLDIVPRLADAEIVDFRPAAELERVYPMGSIRKISGQLRFDGQVSARGNLTSVTY
ncbi:hypothetical protein A249_30949, partial [Pseudomonas syringae pv. actinidiae ICMP 18804]